MEKKTGADVAADALAFGKKVVTGILVLTAIGFLVFIPWFIHGMAGIEQQRQQIQAKFEQLNTQSSANTPLALLPDGSVRSIRDREIDANLKQQQEALDRQERAVENHHQAYQIGDELWGALH